MWKCWYSVLCLYVVTNTDILQSVSGNLPDIASLCPYNDFCHSKATKIRKPDELDLIPCCQMCSCEPDCQDFGNCCPDKKLTPGVDVKYPCVGIASYFNDQRGFSKTTFDTFYYRIVDKCPNAILDLVNPRCSNIIELEDFIFVSDPSTERVYKNKHCALCHGVTNYTEWRLITSNCQFYTGRNVEEWHSYIKTNCSIIPIPPDRNAGNLVRCYRSLKTDSEKRARCNYTGKWETYDKDIDVACNEESPFINNMYTRDTVDEYFENVYCKFCNKDQYEIWPDLCIDNSPHLFGKSSSRFSMFINYKTQPDEDRRISQRCHKSQIWNPFNESCMNVICPSASYLHKGTCENMYKRTLGNTYVLMFRIISYNGVYTKDLLTHLHHTLTRVIGNTECKKCGTYLQAHYNSNYYLEYSLNTQDSCTEDFIISKVKDFTEYSPFSLRLGNGSKITMEYALDGYNLTQRNSVLPPAYSLFCPLEYFISWEMIDKCPRIPISSLESSDFIHQITTERRDTLCVNEYFKIMDSLRNSQVTEHAHIHVILNVVVVLVCIFV